MKKKAPKLFNQINEDDVFSAMNSNFKSIIHEWFNLQTEWMNHSYKVFHDSEKYLILIYLFLRTLETYSEYLIKLNIEDYFGKNKIEIESFNIIDISKKLNIPKESARRKIVELEKSKIILRLKKKLIIDRSAFQYQRPIKSIVKISSFLSNFSEILLKEKILKKKMSSDTIDKYIRQNFTYCWKFFYEMYIPILVLWKNYHGDLNTFYIFSLCLVNDTLENQKKTGINAMSISDISEIPRATVIRKLKLLVKKKLLTVDDKKLYKVNEANLLGDLIKVQTVITKNLSSFVTKIFNGIRI